MKAWKRHYNQWIEKYNDWQRVVLLAISVLTLTIVWYFVFMHPLNLQLDSYTAQTDQIKYQLKQTQDEINTILNNAKKPADPKLIQKKELLQLQLTESENKVSSLSKTMVSDTEMSKALKAIMTKENGLELVNIKSSPPTLVTRLNGFALPANSLPIYSHNITLEFQGTYFATLHYLQRLEKLPWHLFWDELNYEVIKYPQAKIVLTVHTLNTQGSD